MKEKDLICELINVQKQACQTFTNLSIKLKHCERQHKVLQKKLTQRNIFYINTTDKFYPSLTYRSKSPMNSSKAN